MGTVALFLEGMDEWLATEVLRADGLANAWYLNHGMGCFVEMDCSPYLRATAVVFW